MGEYKDRLPGGINSDRVGVKSRYRIAGGRYGYRLESKQNDAIERQTFHDGLTPEQQIARLDERLGKGQGARRERKRLNNQIKNRSSKKEASDVQV